MDKIKVLYIAGTGRVGSTLLGELLGQCREVFHAGEIRYLWQRGLNENLLCGCGTHFRDCDVWGNVIRQAFGDSVKHSQFIEDVIRLQYSVDRNKYIPFLDRGGFRDNLSRYAHGYLRPLYSAVKDVSRTHIIVDTSKHPSYLHILARCGFIDLYVVHLVRDSRGVSYSWTKKKLQQENGAQKIYMKQISPARSAAYWLLHNVFIAGIKKHLHGNNRYLFLKYEDFVNDPELYIRNIFEFIGVEGAAPVCRDGLRVQLKKNHTVSGNPMRFQKGRITVQADTQWVEHMSAKDKLTVTLMTFPLLKRYGYSLCWDRTGK